MQCAEVQIKRRKTNKNRENHKRRENAGMQTRLMYKYILGWTGEKTL